MNHNNLSSGDRYLVQSEDIFTFFIDWCLTERFKGYKSTQNQRDWFGTDVVLRILVKGVCDKIAFLLCMYFIDCTLTLLFIGCQIQFTRSCYSLFWKRQCCGIAKFLFKISQWSASIQWRQNSHYIGSRFKQGITNLTILRKKLYLPIYNTMLNELFQSSGSK